MDTKTKGATAFDLWFASHTTMEAVLFLKVTSASLHNWRSGRTLPQWHHRGNIESLCGIPMGDWLQPEEMGQPMTMNANAPHTLR